MMDAEPTPIVQGSRNLEPSCATNKDQAASFTFAAMARQRDGIDRLGIPGRIWEAAYLLTRYLASNNVDVRLDTRGRAKAGVEYDPPWIPGSTLSTSTNVDQFRPATPDKNVYVSSKRVEADPHAHSGDVVLIELGAGMGYVGLAAAESISQHFSQRDDDDDTSKGVAKHARVVLTDLPDVCVLLKENVALQMEQWNTDGIHEITLDTTDNPELRGLQMADDRQEEEGESSSVGNVTIQVRNLAWGNAEHIRTLSTELCTRYRSCGGGVERGHEGPRMTILCSDLVYFPTLLAPLLRTLIQLTSPDFLPDASPQANILIAYRVRSIERETPFWRAFGAWFHFEPILTRPQSPDNAQNGPNADIDGNAEEWQRVGWDESGLSFLFVAHRRLETLDWTCPVDDKELLYGGQVDDTFEILLMLCSASGAIDD